MNYFGVIEPLEVPRIVNHIDVDACNGCVNDRSEPSTHPQIAAHQQVRQRNRRFQRFKGFGTILLLTGSFSMVWTPIVFNFLIPMKPHTIAALDMMSMSNTWVQPVVYLITNSEARRQCLKSLSVLWEQLRRIFHR